MQTAFERYLVGLRRLPIVNPTDQDMISLCPHLSPEVAIREFREGTHWLALPPVIVDGAFQIVRFYEGGKTQMPPPHDVHQPDLDLSGSGRLGVSDSAGRVRFAEEAVDFARKNWKEQLRTDDWIQIIEYRLIDLATFHTIRRATLTMNRDLNEIINDHTAPFSQQIQLATMFATTDPLQATELRGGRASHNLDCCQYCGGGLTYAACLACGRKFDSGGMLGGQIPLTETVEELFTRDGHVFEISPVKAREKDRGKW
jgi:hypothetical protein